MLTLYPINPMIAPPSLCGARGQRRVDLLHCPELAPGEPSPAADVVDYFHRTTVDRMERAVPAEVLRRHALERGLADAVEAAGA